ncbi:MAG TPA: hypothetical protein VEJ63_10975 [Planctomycetota bacterium]|nr:hypothetical protein [Planctomycetota bacterium]
MGLFDPVPSQELSPRVTRAVALVLMVLGGTLLVLTLHTWIEDGSRRAWPAPGMGLLVSFSLLAIGVAVDRDRIRKSPPGQEHQDIDNEVR